MQPTSAPSGHLLPEEVGSSGIRASTIYILGTQRRTTPAPRANPEPISLKFESRGE